MSGEVSTTGQHLWVGVVNDFARGDAWTETAYVVMAPTEAEAKSKLTKHLQKNKIPGEVWECHLQHGDVLRTSGKEIHGYETEA